MQNLPQPPQNTSVSHWMRDVLIPFVNSLRLRGDGRTCRVNQTEDGTTITIIQPDEQASIGNSDGGDGTGGYSGPFAVEVNGTSVHISAGSIVSSGLYGADNIVSVPSAALTVQTSTFALYLLYYFNGSAMTTQYSTSTSMPSYSFGYSWRIGSYSGGKWHQTQFGDILQIDDVFPHYGNHTILGSGLENGKIYRFPVAGWLVGSTTMQSNAGYLRLYCGGEISGGTFNPVTFELEGASWGSNRPLIYQAESTDLRRQCVNFCVPVHAGCNLMIEWYAGAGADWYEQPFSGGAANIFIPSKIITS